VSSPSAGSPHPEANPPPPELALAVFLVREAAALLFVAGWLVLFAIELFTGRYTLPWWVHLLGTGVLGFALGINAAELVYRPPSKRQVVRRVVAGREGEG
jgi:hypothetical protein